MIRKIHLILCFTIMLSLGACGKKDKEPETVAVGNGGDQVNLDSSNASGGEVDNEESTLEIGVEKTDTMVIIVDWNKIIINDNESNNIEEMKDQIIKSGCTKIDLQHDDASKEALDEIVDVLKKIEETLEIDVNYN